MKFTLPDAAQFNFKDCVVAGDECVLVTPKDMGVEWNDDNKYFRSSIWCKSDMKPVSLGFRKFTNYGEKPEFEPLAENAHVRMITKKDGSCLIVSMYKDELIVRTRGTVDASKLANGHEIEYIKQKYPKAFANEWLDCEMYTLLFEWTTPTNRIVLNESVEPTLWLIGMVAHNEYSYVSQHNLDIYAEEMGVERPKSYGINLGMSLADIKKNIEPLQDIEGVVIYEDIHGQILKKVKTLRYLQLHRVFTGIKTVDHLYDVWKESGFLFYGDFKEWLAEQYDYELVESLKELINDLFVVRDQLVVLYRGVHEYVHQAEFQNKPRKEQAQEILKTWGKWSAIAFEALDGKDFDWDKMWKINKKDQTTSNEDK